MTIEQDIQHLRSFMREAQRQLGSEVDHTETNAAFERVTQKALGRREKKTSVAGTNYIVHIVFDEDTVFCTRARRAVNTIDLDEVHRLDGREKDEICRTCLARYRVRPWST